METKTRMVLKHRETGLYWGDTAENTKHLFKAKRFLNLEQLGMWLEHSYFKPKRPAEYEPIEVELTIKEMECDLVED